MLKDYFAERHITISLYGGCKVRCHRGGVGGCGKDRGGDRGIEINRNRPVCPSAGSVYAFICLQSPHLFVSLPAYSSSRTELPSCICDLFAQVHMHSTSTPWENVGGSDMPVSSVWFPNKAPPVGLILSLPLDLNHPPAWMIYQSPPLNITRLDSSVTCSPLSYHLPRDHKFLTRLESHPLNLHVLAFSEKKN